MDTRDKSGYKSEIPGMEKFHLYLALGFSLIVLTGMIILSFAGTYYYKKISDKNEKQLETVITEILSDSISRISFSGKYHSRLLIEKITRSQPRIAFIAIAGKKGIITAHSNKSFNDTHLAREDLKLAEKVMKEARPHISETLFRGMPVRQIAMPYRLGYRNEITGVVFVGITTGSLNEEIFNSKLRIALLIALISLISLVATYYLSGFFAIPVKSLALQMKGILKHSPVVIMIFDKYFRIREQSRRFIEYPGPMPLRFKHLMDRTLEGREISDEIVINGNNGKEELYAFIGFPIQSGSDGKTEKACLIGMDITSRRKAQKKLEDIRNYLRSIFDSMPSVLAGINTRREISHWNAEAEKYTGCDRYSVEGKKIENIFPGISCLKESISRAFEKAKPQTKNRVPCYVGNSCRFLDIVVFPLAGKDTRGAVVRIDDVTDRVHFESMMVQTEKMMSIGGLATGMAHELNNPLGIILQACENINRRLNSDIPANRDAALECGADFDTLRMYFKKRAIEDFIGDIKEAGERSAEIIKNMLKFARNEKGGFRKCHAETLINETLELAEKDYSMKKNLNFRDIGIVKEIAKDAEWIICVENQIQQVFLNILKNAALAIHNSKGKNGKGLIKFSISRDNGSITVKIRDNGTGMTEDVRKRIFEPFFSTKTTGNGTGLGLSVSYFIVTENHKGTLKVVSAEGKGAEFIIKLPWREHTQE